MFLSEPRMKSDLMPTSGETVLVGEDRYLKNKYKWVAGILKYREDSDRLGPIVSQFCMRW